MQVSDNFAFLKSEFELLATVATLAERNVYDDPNTTFFKIRQFLDLMTEEICNRSMLSRETLHRDGQGNTSLKDRIDLIVRVLKLDPPLESLFQSLRKVGNSATHGQYAGMTPENAATALKMSWHLSRWFYSTFAKKKTDLTALTFKKPLPLIDEAQATPELLAQYAKEKAQREALIEDLQRQLLQKSRDAEAEIARKDAALKAQDEALLKALEEAGQERLRSQALNAQLASLKEESSRSSAEAEAAARRVSELEQELAKACAKAATSLKPGRYVSEEVRAAAQAACVSESESLKEDEALARERIDLELKALGWEVSSVSLRYSLGARPVKGRARAIAEYPVAGGRADYVLFDGLTPVAVLEAKKSAVTTAGKIEQAEFYSRNFVMEEGLVSALQPDEVPWQVSPESQDTFKVPFVIASNGNPYYSRDPEHSGTWWRDLRSPSNIRASIGALPSPASLRELLKHPRLKTYAKEDAAESLSQDVSLENLQLRPYQVEAIRSVERALATKRSRFLIAMATGTGKTRVAKALMYRLLKRHVVRRILFVVDVNLLAEQTYNVLNDGVVEGGQPFTSIYQVNARDNFTVESHTRVQICTVQGLLSLLEKNDELPVNERLSPFDFDLIILDEAHRNYREDAEASENERTFLPRAAYEATYRKAIDFFASRVLGFTATPSEQSIEYLGEPVYEYGFRQAVMDGYLADALPPVVYHSQLSETGIKLSAGQTVSFFNTRTHRVTEQVLDEDLAFSLRQFNSRVVTESFNREVLTWFINRPEVDIFSKRKSLIFCALDSHADQVKRLLDELLHEKYGERYDEKLVAKITGQSFDPHTLTRRYRLEKDPNIAITVDLLTTGVDVPSICNLLFLRVTSSGVMYEQMLGRATRLCPGIDKTTFTVFDAVGITELMRGSAMRPVDRQADKSTEDLLNVLGDPGLRDRALASKGDGNSEAGEENGEVPSYAEEVRRSLILKLRRLLSRALKLASTPEVKPLLERLEALFDRKAEEIVPFLESLPAESLGLILQSKLATLRPLLKALEKALQQGRDIPIDVTGDTFISAHTDYGGGCTSPYEYLKRLQDFLKAGESNADIKDSLNAPWLLSYERLKLVSDALFDDAAHFTATSLKQALSELLHAELTAEDTAQSKSQESKTQDSAASENAEPALALPDIQSGNSDEVSAIEERFAVSLKTLPLVPLLRALQVLDPEKPLKGQLSLFDFGSAVDAALARTAKALSLQDKLTFLKLLAAALKSEGIYDDKRYNLAPAIRQKGGVKILNQRLDMRLNEFMLTLLKECYLS